MAKKIDESVLQNLMAGENPPITNTNEKEKPSPTPKQANTLEKDYPAVYLQARKYGKKDRRCVYISRGFYETICKIVNLLGDKELTIGIYIDNVLSSHFTEYSDTINQLYAARRATKLIDND